MPRSIYLVNPKSDSPTYFQGESYGAQGLPLTTQMADLSTPTVAAMCPASFGALLCDENVTPIDWNTPADFIGLTGKITQFGRMKQIAAEFRRRGKVVIIGGPYASLCPDMARPHCDVLIRGEIEEIASGLFSDLKAGSWKEEYVGTQPGLETSPLPRWDLYPLDHAVMGTVQTSRGCPFECEFCDVIQYVGRKQRHKTVSQVLRELDLLYALGQRIIFLADDNFTAFRSRAKELLLALGDWNRKRPEGKVHFVTQVSIDSAKDEELLRLCAEAGLMTVFIGIETPNEDALRETKKRQNLRVDLVEQVGQFHAHGIAVVGGMIVGFDADGPDIFERQFNFAMRAAIPIVSLGALVAPAATPLYDRMKRENRLKDKGSEVAAVPWATNIVPKGLTQEQLFSGLKWLANNLYHPDAFGDRLITFIERLGKRRDPRSADVDRTSRPRRVDLAGMHALENLRKQGSAEGRMFERVTAAIARKPSAAEFVGATLTQYVQIRYMYDQGQFWEPQLAGREPDRTEGLVSLSSRRT